VVSIVERQHGQSRGLAVPRVRLVLGFFVFQALIGLPGQGLGGRAALEGPTSQTGTAFLSRSLLAALAAASRQRGM
jgi:hypothetical protein